MAAKRNTRARQGVANRLEARDVAEILASRGTETQHQIAVVEYLERIGATFCHVPNGGRRSKAEAANLKRAGVRRGVQDLLVFGIVGRNLPRVAIEMKADGGRVSADQRKWRDDLLKLGWTVGTAWSATEAVSLLQGEGYR